MVIDIDAIFLLIYTGVLEDVSVVYTHSQNRVQMGKRLRKPFISEVISALGKQLDSCANF